MMDVVALGELLIDFTSVSCDVDGYPTMAAHPGGAPANFLAALAKFGAKTALLGKVGKDAFGNLLVQTLKNAGIEIKGIVMAEDVFTTLAFVTLDETGDREFSFARKPGADTCISFEESLIVSSPRLETLTPSAPETVMPLRSRVKSSLSAEMTNVSASEMFCSSLIVSFDTAAATAASNE